MRFVYLDESGISNPDFEKYVVVVGVIVNADKQWKALEKHLLDMADRLVSPEQRYGFYFHAMDLQKGECWKPHEGYPHEWQRSALRNLCKIPGLFDLPVVAGYIERAKVAKDFPNMTNHAITVMAQGMAAAICAGQVELYMRRTAPDEVAALVYEDNGNARELIKTMHNFCRKRTASEDALKIIGAPMTQILPFQHVVDGAYFAAKSDTSLLQIADACAFAIRRHMMKIDRDSYYPELYSMIVMDPEFFDHDGYGSLFSVEQSS